MSGTHRVIVIRKFCLHKYCVMLMHINIQHDAVVYCWSNQRSRFLSSFSKILHLILPFLHIYIFALIETVIYVLYFCDFTWFNFWTGHDFQAILRVKDWCKLGLSRNLTGGIIEDYFLPILAWARGSKTTWTQYYTLAQTLNIEHVSAIQIR